MGLSRCVGAGLWQLELGLADTLWRIGERGDIIRTMQRAHAGQAHAPALAELAVYDPAAADAVPLVGRVVTGGLADRRYGLIEATDARAHYVPLGSASDAGPLVTGAIVRIEPRRGGVRTVDRTIVDVATATAYRLEAHLRHDPSASGGFREGACPAARGDADERSCGEGPRRKLGDRSSHRMPAGHRLACASSGSVRATHLLFRNVRKA